MDASIKIAVVDDHKLFRNGLIPMINEMEDIKVLIDAGNGLELLDQLEDQLVDVILMDLKMPEMGGKEATIKVKELYPDIQVIMLSSHDEERAILELVELGVKGYLLKDAEIEEVEMAIRSVMQNGFYFNDRISKILL